MVRIASMLLSFAQQLVFWFYKGDVFPDQPSDYQLLKKYCCVVAAI